MPSVFASIPKLFTCENVLRFGSFTAKVVLFNYSYLQLIIPQYFISNKSGIWSLSLIVHSKG